MSKITPELVSADAVVLATPVYYFSIAAQLKVCMDRFYSVNDILTTQKKKAALITCAGGPEEITTKGVLGTYEGCVDYLGWTDRGVVAARGCNSPEDLKGTDFEEQAYALGKNL